MKGWSLEMLKEIFVTMEKVSKHIARELHGLVWSKTEALETKQSVEQVTAECSFDECFTMLCKLLKLVVWCQWKKKQLIKVSWMNYMQHTCNDEKRIRLLVLCGWRSAEAGCQWDEKGALANIGSQNCFSQCYWRFTHFFCPLNFPFEACSVGWGF